MKKTTPFKRITSITAVFVLIFFGLSAKAQNLKGQSVFTLDVGMVNFTKTAVTAAWLDEEDATVKTAPPIILGFDYALADRFSLGLNFSTQGVKGTVTDYSYTNDQFQSITETFDYKMRRTHIGIVPKFHYLKDNDKVDLYSGLRFGYLIWSKKFDSTDPSFPDDYGYSINNFKSRVTVGLIAFGARFYFTESLGANVELNIGAPYVFSAGLVYKMGGSSY